jgi:hypothetical protein
MGKEVLSVPEESLSDVARVIRAGLRSEVVPHDVNQSLNAWCNKMAPQPMRPRKRSRPVKIGIDIGGVLTKYPEIVVPLMTALGGHPAFEVHVLTDMPREKAVEMLVANGVSINFNRLHACDYATHGERCKAVKASKLGLDMLWDDHVGYVASPGEPPMRMLVMPDAGRDYYHPTWKTPGQEGSFGRVLQTSAPAPAKNAKKTSKPKKARS